MPKTALVTGITGQDGAYLCRLLLEKGYTVYGAYRRSASSDFWRLAELGIEGEVQRIPFDLLEESNVIRALEKTKPDEIYNLAAQSFVAVSFEMPLYTSQADAIGPLRILEAIRNLKSNARFYQASTSEMFGKVRETPQRESTPFHPRSPYGVAKLFGHWITVNYRESHGMHASSGILFNHESPLRGTEFVTRKITATLAMIKHGTRDLLELGNMDALRDWGFAGDYVEGIHLMTQQPVADDFVLATGVNHSVREFVDLAATAAGFNLAWEGEDQGLHAIDRNSGKLVVRVNPDFYRPAEVETLLGDPTKAREVLGWTAKTTLPELVQMMVEADLRKAEKGVLFL